MLIGFDGEVVIHESKRTIIRRARRRSDGAPLILKAPKSEFPTSAQRARLRHEFELLRGLRIAGVVRALDLVEGDHGPVLVLEDRGHRALRALIGPRGMELERFLPIASALARTAAELHHARVVHRDITPSNIVVDERSDQPCIIDFSIASRLSREYVDASSQELEGTLPYLAPERTGRMNRAADWRSDLYSLGAVFYELLTGRPPVVEAGLSETIHSIIARTPPPPHELRPELPHPLSKIVMKLLTKTMEERYQGGRGLAFDLDEAARQFTATGRIEPFELGTHDAAEGFHLPQKLYGRDEPVGRLSATFERVCCGDTKVLMLMGAPGVGKSSLVHEAARSSVVRRGSLVEGKFDQFERGIPLVSVVRALRELLHRLLTLPDDQLRYWKERLGKAVGQSGALLKDALPELELLLGKQPPVPEVSSEENRNRVNALSLRLIQALADEAHPLVMFFDDLQWADLASLELLQRVSTDPDTHHVLLLGAYRDTEVDATHILTRALEGMRAAGVLQEMVLGPLDREQVLTLVSDALKRTTSSIRPLAEFIFETTQGNPFFVREMLTAFHETGRLRRDSDGAWNWDMGELRAQGVSDVVASLMMDRLRRQTGETQALLQVAACIGSHFDVHTLAVVCERTEEQILRLLWPALEAGLVLPLSASLRLMRGGGEEAPGAEGEHDESSVCRFAHDWVQQAAHDIVPAESRGAMHLRIGRLLLDKLDVAKRETRLFEIVRHFDEGLELIEEPSERERLAELYLLAGRRAMRAAAYESAHVWFRRGRGLLAADAWSRAYALALPLHTEGAEAARITRDFAEMEALVTVVRERARGVLDLVAIYETLIQYQIMHARMGDAVNVARELLERLGQPLPPNPSTLRVAWTLLTTVRMVRRKGLEHLSALPRMTRPTSLAAMRVMISVAAAAFTGSPKQFVIIACRMVQISVRDGHCNESSWAYLLLATLVALVLGQYEEGYKLGHFGIQLMEGLGARELLAKNHASMYAGLQQWRGHWRECAEPLERAQHTALEVGDHEFAGNVALVRSWLALFVGEPLDVAQRIQEECLTVAERYKSGYATVCIRTLLRLVLDLRGAPSDHIPVQDDEASRARLLQSKNLTAVYLLYMRKGLLAWLLGDPLEAIEHFTQARRYEDSLRGTIVWSEVTYFQSLAILHGWSGATASQRRTFRRNRSKLRAWARQAPFNFQQKLLLIEAEWARIKGRKAEALRLYEQVASVARTNGFTQDAAIAMERAGRYQLELGLERAGRSCLNDALRAYRSWGATAKADALESELKASQGGLPAQPHEEARPPPGTALDMETILTSSRAISEELVLDTLTRKLIRLLIQNAGAERGLLILERDGKLLIEASASIADAGDHAPAGVPLEGDEHVSSGIVNFVVRTGQSVVLHDAAVEGMFVSDPFIAARRPRAVLCAPLINQQRLVAVVYLENNVTSHAFNDERLRLVRILLSQAALSIHNARLYSTLEESNRRLAEYSHILEVKVEERTRDLRNKNEELYEALVRLRETQNRLVSQEKLASLGALTAGIAHELKNPLNFVNNFAQLSANLTSELASLLSERRSQFAPEVVSEIDETVQLLSDNLRKIYEHGKRADGIISSMLMHTRVSEAPHQPTNLNKLVTDSIRLAFEGFRSLNGDVTVQWSSSYDERIGFVELSPTDFCRVLINIISNAIDAVQERRLKESSDYTPELVVRTVDLGERVEVRIIDNGTGIPPHIVGKIFNPFFTTKAPGRGSGLGLSLSHDIIVQGHQGELRVETVEGQGTEFIISVPKQSAANRKVVLAHDA